MFLIIFGVLVVLITYLLISRVRHMSILARNGIPGPKPNLIYGNMIEYRALPAIQRQKDWIEKYGKIVGFYMGHRPSVLVADPDLAKNIQIKDFLNFPDRPKLPIKHSLHPNPISSGSLIRVDGKRWKEMRSVLTPTFSSSKLKTMTPIIDDAINSFIDIIENHSQNESDFNIFDLFQSLTTDVIGRTAFGIQSNVQNESNNRFLDAAKKIFNFDPKSFYLLFLIQCFPQIDYILYPFRRLNEIIRDMRGMSPNGVLYSMARDIIQLRKQNTNIKRKDLLQLMLDTKISGEEMSAMTDENLTSGNESELKTQNKTTIGKVGKRDFRLTNDEITANCVLFYEAGFETTSTLLGLTAHVLVNYPDVQEKVRSEVNELYENEGKLDFNTVSKLQYMECVLNETMRIYPPVISFVSRGCLADYKYKDITIPKGTDIIFCTHYLHHDSDYWSEPEKFDPERFSPERKHEIHTSSWQPFGSGPRNCIGMRFALFEAKLALAKLLLSYRLVPSPRTEIGELTTVCKMISLSPKKGVFAKAVKL